MARTFQQPESVRCKWCGAVTPATGTKVCIVCWRLEFLIRNDPELAQRMLDALRAEPPDPEIPVVLTGPENRARKEAPDVRL